MGKTSSGITIKSSPESANPKFPVTTFLQRDNHVGRNGVRPSLHERLPMSCFRMPTHQTFVVRTQPHKTIAIFFDAIHIANRGSVKLENAFIIIRNSFLERTYPHNAVRVFVQRYDRIVLKASPVILPMDKCFRPARRLIQYTNAILVTPHPYQTVLRQGNRLYHIRLSAFHLFRQLFLPFAARDVINPHTRSTVYPYIIVLINKKRESFVS